MRNQGLYHWLFDLLKTFDLRIFKRYQNRWYYLENYKLSIKQQK